MDFTLLVVLSLACAYIVKSLILSEKFGHEGPFKLKDNFVVFKDTGHVQKVCLFDQIRRPFGVYDIEKSGDGKVYWAVNPERSERWTCPFCLSFWVVIPATVFFVAMNPELIIYAPAVHFAISSGSTIGYGLIERSLL